MSRGSTGPGGVGGRGAVPQLELSMAAFPCVPQTPSTLQSIQCFYPNKKKEKHASADDSKSLASCLTPRPTSICSVRKQFHVLLKTNLLLMILVTKALPEIRPRERMREKRGGKTVRGLEYLTD